MKNAGATVPVHSIKACVVYDAASGRIHHHHRVLTLVGGREPGDEEIAADAMAHATGKHATGRHARRPDAKLEVLHVPHDAHAPGKRYRVDVRKKALVVEK